jgi:DNA-directed RNA polymerase subunit F
MEPRMSNDERSTSAAVLSLFRSLSAEEQRVVREALLREPDASSGPDDANSFREKLVSAGWEIVESHWITLEEAAEDLLRSKSQASRDAKAGRLLTNGKTGRHLRIFGPSVMLYNFRLALHYLQKCLRLDEDPDQTYQGFLEIFKGLQGFACVPCTGLTPQQKRCLRKKLDEPGGCYEVIRFLIDIMKKLISSLNRYVGSLYEAHRPN